jgi:hypothetical protein
VTNTDLGAPSPLPTRRFRRPNESGTDDLLLREVSVLGVVCIYARRYYIPDPLDGESAMCAQLTAEDEGKDVVNTEGDKIGVVQSVEAGTAYVNPDPGITDEFKSTLGWGDSSEDTYALDDHQIEAITDGSIQIRK